MSSAPISQKVVSCGLIILFAAISLPAYGRLPRPECIAKADGKYSDPGKTIPWIAPRYVRLHSSQLDVKMFFRHAVLSGPYNAVNSAKYGFFFKKNLGQIEAMAPAFEDGLPEYYILSASHKITDRGSFDYAVKVACQLEMPGRIEVESFGIHQSNPPRAPEIVTR